MMRLPSEGFNLTGLQLGSLSLSGIGVPGASTQAVSFAEFRPRNALRVPGVDVAGIRIPSVHVPQIVSTGTVNINNAQATRRDVSLNLGVLGFKFWVQPVIDIHIDALTLGNVALSLAIDRLRLENLSAPVIVKGFAAGDLQLREIRVNQISL